MALFLQHGFLCFSPPAPSAHSCQHPASTRRAIAVPRPCANAGPQGQPQNLTCLESQPGGWGKESGGEFGEQGEATTTPGSLLTRLWVENSCPTGALALEMGHEGSLDRGKFPSSAEGLPLRAMLGSPHGCSKTLPATLQTLASPVLHFNRPGPLRLILGWVILSSFH